MNTNYGYFTIKKITIHALSKYCMALLILISCQVNATISSINVSNSNPQMSITQTGHSQLNWTVTESNSTGGQVTVSSSEGVFNSPDGAVLGQVLIPIQATRATALRSNTLIVFSESLTVPLNVIRQAQKRGDSRFSYTRIFFDSNDNSSASATVNFAISGGSVASELGIVRLELEFDDGRTSAILAPDSKFQARAKLNYQGTGLLEYTWEIASPPSTNGTPVFFPLVSRKQFLLAGNLVTLLSPELPSKDDGHYLLRLRIDKPLAQFAMPFLRYAISSTGQSPAVKNIQPMSVTLPAEDSLLTVDTNFSWLPVAKAMAYQLEIYLKPTRENNLPGAEQQVPLTGVLVPSSKTQLTVGNLPRTYLVPGTTYYWRVTAFSADGQAIAQSEFRRIKF